MEPTFSIVIPALDAAEELGAGLAALADGAERLDAEIIVVDGGSRDATREVARRAGSRVIGAPRGRGTQLMAGAAAAGGSWLLFLHADTRPGPGWDRVVAEFAAHSVNQERAAAFRFALDDGAAGARRLEAMVAWRCRVLALPYGDQGLLMARGFYDRLGGYRALPLYEDVELIRRIGRRRLVMLDHGAVTSGARYRKSGYLLRPARNLGCLALYFIGVPPRHLVRLYG
jgi:rSAM/selenodomain-associated transferase 2